MDWRHLEPHPAPVFHACQVLQVQPAETLMVGDDQRDIVAGQAAGATSLAALWGYIQEHDNPADWGADGILTRATDLDEWLD